MFWYCEVRGFLDPTCRVNHVHLHEVGRGSGGRGSESMSTSMSIRSFADNRHLNCPSGCPWKARTHPFIVRPRRAGRVRTTCLRRPARHRCPVSTPDSSVAGRTSRPQTDDGRRTRSWYLTDASNGTEDGARYSEGAACDTRDRNLHWRHPGGQRRTPAARLD